MINKKLKTDKIITDDAFIETFITSYNKRVAQNKIQKFHRCEICLQYEHPKTTNIKRHVRSCFKITNKKSSKQNKKMDEQRGITTISTEQNEDKNEQTIKMTNISSCEQNEEIIEENLVDEDMAGC